jgi:multidrug efflux pump subunit AcrA (membrane-fusion protein)
VVLTARFGRAEYQWQGRVVRSEGAVDTSSRQLYVVAQVDDPYARGPAGRPPLRIGQFVEAEISGRRLENVVVLPAAALREGGEVLVVDDASRLQRRSVDVIWGDGERVVIDAGLSPGDLVATTPMSVAANGTLVTVTVDGQAPDQGSDAVAADAASVR